MIPNLLRCSVLGLVLVVAGGGVYYEYQNTRPCMHSIPYAIGKVDSRFGITTAAVVTDAKAAAAIWNKAAGKTLLTYDPQAKLKIGFIYDEREANAKLGTKITQQQAANDVERAALDAAQSNFAAEQAAYNEKVSAINARGGATEAEAEVLTVEQASLKNLADSINAQVNSFNANIKALNTVIQQYDKTTGHTFEQGEYVRDSMGERISIFEFTGTVQLERVLAHELGHAIGLGHNSDPKSIMFAKNESGNLVPTSADLAALRAVCGT